MSNKIVVAEIFASIQGEGSTMGVPSIFLRLAGCNLMCGGKGTEHDKQLHNGATWRCDSIEVWRKGVPYETLSLLEELISKFNIVERMEQGWHLIITGGEPMMQAAQLIEFVKTLHIEARFDNNQIEFETNGTIWNDSVEWFALREYQFNVSPKLTNSGETALRRFKQKTLENISTACANSIFKFVCSNDKDIYEVQTYYQFLPRKKIILMPAASYKIELEVRSRWLVEKCLKLNYKFSSRLQVAIWDKTTGV